MIVLSMLGTGNYQPSSYAWKDQTSQPTDFFQVALLEWFPEAEILICVTKEAKEKHGQVIQQLMPQALLIDIPSGKDEAEYWDIFSIIEQHIPTGAKLVFDMTHGFRSLPTLALLAVSFLRAAKAVELEHVLYGAFEAKTDDIAPVFDLTPFVKMLDWASATNRFLETGDSSKFRPLVETRGAKPLNVNLNAGVKVLDELSNALAANRARQSGVLAAKALEKIKLAREGAWEKSHEPLRLLLAPLEAGLSLLALDDQQSQQYQLVQSFGQINWFLQHRQYERAVGVAREWMVSFCQWKREGIWLPIKLSEREKTEKWLGQCLRKDIDPSAEWKDFVELWGNLGNLRNDLLHFGFRDQPRSGNSIPNEVTEKVKTLRNLAQGFGLELPEPL